MVRRFLRIALGLFALWMFVQVPTKTRIAVTFAPRTPSSLGSSQLSVGFYPRVPLDIIPSTGIIDSTGGRQLIYGRRRTTIPSSLGNGGLLVEARNPLISLGAQHLTDLHLSLPASELMPLRISFETTDWADSVVRPYRDSCDGSGRQECLTARASMRTETFGSTRVVVDTSPLPFLVPVAWPDAVAGGDVLYSSFARPVPYVAGDKVPAAGLNLPFGIEDELAGAYSQAPVVNVVAVVIDAGREHEIPLSCSIWHGRLSRACWHQIAAFASASCARAWPIRVDTTRNELHVSYTGAKVSGCALIMEVDSPGIDFVHAILLSLRPGSQ
jgi:hypothetical protein